MSYGTSFHSSGFKGFHHFDHDATQKRIVNNLVTKSYGLGEDELEIEIEDEEETEDEDTETWNGYHGQITAPKGTFKKIWESEDGKGQ